jgi:excisionase family DNA binding protein
MIPIRDDPGNKDQPPGVEVRAPGNASDGGQSAVVDLANARPYKLLVTPEEAAEILSVGRTRIFELMASGQLRSVRIRRSRRIPLAALEQLVKQLLDEGDGLQR